MEKQKLHAFWKALLAIALGIALLTSMAAISPAWASLSLNEEREIGRQIYQRLEKEGKLIKNEKVTSYIDELGKLIVAQTEERERFFEFDFSVLKSPSINAFATPGGFIYVNLGLLTAVDNEAELAGVIAHEIAHVMHRHIASLLQKKSRLSIATIVASLAGLLIAGDISGIAVATGLASATSQTLNLKYSREHEEEADRTALRYLVAAGYDPSTMPSFLKRNNKFATYSSTLPSYMLSHPETIARMAYLENAILTQYKDSQGKDDILGRLPKIQSLLLMSTGISEPSNNLRYFQERLSKYPANPYFKMGIADAYFRMGQNDKAQSYYESAFREAPDDSDILREFGIFKYRIGKNEEAIFYLQASLNAQNDALTKMHLGQALLQKKEFTGILNLYANFDEEAVEYPEIFNQLALAQEHIGALGVSHYYLGAYFEHTGKPEAALLHYERASSLLSAGDKRLGKISEKMAKLTQEIRQNRRQKPSQQRLTI